MMITFLLCASALLSGCIRSNGDSKATSAAEESTAAPIKPYHETAVYTYLSNVDVGVISTGLDKAYLLLANKEEQNRLGESYVPASLTTLTCKTNLDKQIELESRTAAALYEMLDEMAADGVSDIMVTSGYRSYSYQSSLFRNYLEKEKSTITQDAYNYFSAAYLQENYLSQGKLGLSPEDAEKVVLSYSARPGTSEHQTGLCIDFVTSTVPKLTEDFENTEAFAWLCENAYRFGFILRYPKNKTDVTGYTYEPWHYRFVGREAATDIHFSGCTLEEYLAK